MMKHEGSNLKCEGQPMRKRYSTKMMSLLLGLSTRLPVRVSVVIGTCSRLSMLPLSLGNISSFDLLLFPDEEAEPKHMMV